MKTDVGELRTFLTDELDKDSDLEGKSKGYLEIKTQMELEDKLPSDMDSEDVTADFLRGWKAHKQALEDGKLVKDSDEPDTSIDGMSPHIKRKRDRATDSEFLSGESNTLEKKAQKAVASNAGKDLSQMDEKEKQKFLSQHLKDIEDKKQSMASALSSEIVENN